MQAFIIETEKQTIHDLDGKVLFFGMEDFIKKIVKGRCCFICGASPVEKEFNDEHIIPDWVLKKMQLYKKQITLINDTYMKYGSFTVPCCKECNSDLGQQIETPISELLKKSYNEIISAMEADPNLYQVLFRWMCLIYFKTHLKDTLLLMERDKRIDAGYIGDYYNWAEFHHVHAMARAHYTDAIIDPKVYGSLLIVPAIAVPGHDNFDYMDSLGAQVVMLQIDQICLIAVLNDSHIVQAASSPGLSKITGALSSFQLKELFARMVYLNTHIKDRPKYHSTITEKGYEIKATVQEEFEILDGKDEKITLGEILYQYIEKIMPMDTPQRDMLLQEVREGRRAYILNEKGEFIQHESTFD